MAQVLRTTVRIDATDTFRTNVFIPDPDDFPEAGYRRKLGAALWVGPDIEFNFHHGYETPEDVCARIDALVTALAAIRAEVVALAAIRAEVVATFEAVPA